ncbi:MAG: hypothetical protein CO002_01940, partial [Candidatus Portnoybacteria bacterium CG_4_8_14_3_um_filter_44_10]
KVRSGVVSVFALHSGNRDSAFAFQKPDDRTVKPIPVSPVELVDYLLVKLFKTPTNDPQFKPMKSYF